VFHSHNEFARGKAHVNGIESFWSFTKRRLAQFNGLSDETFYFHLKESEFRFNNRFNNIYDIMLKIDSKVPQTLNLYIFLTYYPLYNFLLYLQ
jgi:transposase-like protein